MFGRDRARTIGSLQEQLRTSRRIVERAIESLRRNGSPVVTGPDGAWLTTDPGELRDAYRRLRSRYITQAQGARELLRTARRFEKVQQLEMFG